MFPTFRLVASGRRFGIKTYRRGDGYSFATCDELPGFSYILAPNESPDVMLPTLEAFVTVNSEWLAGKARDAHRQ
jgi:hypothetical protein